MSLNDSDATVDFASTVAPILEQRCVGCHNDEHRKGGLSLRSRRSAFAGGDSGPAFVPGQPDLSLLLEWVAGADPEMPKGGPPLLADEVENLSRWIAEGAHWPEDRTLMDRRFDDPRWWSLEPIQPIEPPTIDDPWIRSPIDRFVLDGMRRQGLLPAPEADRRTLFRRIVFDLHGIPPTAEQMQAFLDDPAPDAYERAVDRLLDSPRYGERWARYWLDIVHYGDTHGYDKDKVRPNAWPYRDYVIDAFQQGKPYTTFVREQVAGDVLWPESDEAVSATGFLAAGPWDFVGHVELRDGTRDKRITQLLDRDDMLATVINTACSLTIQCARCHDHPFDPIRQREYYALQAVFSGVDRGERPLPSSSTASPSPVFALVVLPEPRVVHRLHRGDVDEAREVANPAGLSILRGLDPALVEGENSPEGERRAGLARWLAERNNPLTWRSIVNRAWQFRFGRGLVDTPNDFGRMGSKPSHPELLDWLAHHFREGSQSLKELDRLLVTSSTYRQSSTIDLENQERDPENRWLARMPRRRLDAESLRDALLVCSGAMDWTMGGPGVQWFGFEDDHSPRYLYEQFDPAHPANQRRSIYRFIVRSVPDPLLECLDAADPSQFVPTRNETLTALQALAMLNNRLVLYLSERLAGSIAQEFTEPHEQVAHAFERILCRPPATEEVEILLEYQQRHGLAAMVRLLFNTNEFLFID